MNWVVLKDSKTMWGFAIAILLAILSIVLAVKGNGYSVVPVVFASIMTFLSVNRADKVYKSKS